MARQQRRGSPSPAPKRGSRRGFHIADALTPFVVAGAFPFPDSSGPCSSTRPRRGFARHAVFTSTSNPSQVVDCVPAVNQRVVVWRQPLVARRSLRSLFGKQAPITLQPRQHRHGMQHVPSGSDHRFPDVGRGVGHRHFGADSPQINWSRADAATGNRAAAAAPPTRPCAARHTRRQPPVSRRESPAERCAKRTRD